MATNQPQEQLPLLAATALPPTVEIIQLPAQYTEETLNDYLNPHPGKFKNPAAVKREARTRILGTLLADLEELGESPDNFGLNSLPKLMSEPNAQINSPLVLRVLDAMNYVTERRSEQGPSLEIN